jgi:DNA invertase Pin-like site-specific DNA recombinase
LNTLAAITAKKAGFKSIGDAWADTTTSHGCLMLTVLGGLAEFERDLIRARTGEGRARAVARGQRMGRPPKLTPHQKREAIRRRDSGGRTRSRCIGWNQLAVATQPGGMLRWQGDGGRIERYGTS